MTFLFSCFWLLQTHKIFGENIYTSFVFLFLVITDSQNFWRKYIYLIIIYDISYGGILLSLVTNIWGLLTLVSVVWVIYDVLMKNRSLSDIMKIVWIVVALIFGILGAAAYYLFGRKK
ncbi:TPA: hypothetical protein HA351_07050 [Methanosarcinaceae archaeon]|nr:hypothetical protein [Methanosarcinaceae archaeon]